MPKLSIIVPVYNVEDYLKRCIDSIINQNFKDFELILVDDGSTDMSPSICDDYSNRDKRVIVIHKKNAGLSSARNKGLDIAKGDYIGFVDSDDWIAPNMYLDLVNFCESNKLDLAICGVELCYENTNKNQPYYMTTNDRIMSKTEALEELFCNNSFGEEAWNKLYTKKVFANIRYPVGKIHEDTYCICDILNKCKKIGYKSGIGYFYYQRQNSIMNNLTSAPSVDKILSVENVLNYLSNYPEIFKNSAPNLLSAPLKNIKSILKNRSKDDYLYLRELKHFYLKHFKDIITIKNIPLGEKILMISLSVSWHLTKVIISLWRI